MNIKSGTDPFELFSNWFEQAQKAEINDPDAMALASVDAHGMPSVRMVLLKRWSPKGFVFFTNYESRKARELDAGGKAALCIHWKSLRRQVRATGKIARADAALSDEYFASRGRASRIGAWASAQSRQLGSREELERAVAEMEARYVEDVPRPPHWGGFVIHPVEIEFWHDGKDRLHDRFLFTRDGADDWDIKRLSP